MEFVSPPFLFVDLYIHMRPTLLDLYCLIFPLGIYILFYASLRAMPLDLTRFTGVFPGLLLE